jgi:HlyD family secretion protein
MGNLEPHMPNNRHFPWLKWLIVLLVLGGIGWAVWHFTRGEDATPQYQTTKVSRGDVTQVVTATGQLNPVLNVQVGSQISGIIQKLYVDFNSQVKSNQIIAQLDAATFQANVHQAEGELANAKAALELAQLNARRAGELHKANLISQAEFDKATIDLHQAEAAVKIREASLEKSKVDLSRCTIYAPVDGSVISRNVDVGQTVAASLSAPTLFVIANDLSKMQIDANIAEADIGGVELGQDVEFTVDAFPTRTFRGKVAQVRNSPITVQNVVTYDTVIEVSNPDLKLKPGMTANVSVVIARRENTLKIPNSALRFRPPEAVAAEMKTNAPAQRSSDGARGESAGDMAGSPSGGGGRRGGRGANAAGGAARMRTDRPVARTVYVLRNTNATEPAKPEPVQVKLGISDGISTEVIEGLSENDVVVTGIVATQSDSSKPSNPFGSSMRRGF